MIFIKVIYEKDKSLRLLDFNETEHYQLEDLKFYIPKEFKEDFFVLLTDAHNVKTVLKLNKTQDVHKKYSIYAVDGGSMVTTEPGKTAISIFYIDNNTFQTSNSFKANLQYDNFNYISQLMFLQKLDKKLAERFDKIKQMTQLNINLYKDIEEVLES